MRALILALLVSAASAEPDGAIAQPGRWTHARGPAANNGRSEDGVFESLGGVRWTFASKDPLAMPPLTWDGVVFTLDASGQLTALDAATGAKLAQTRVKSGAEPRAACFDRSVFVIEEGARIVQHRLAADTFARRWTRATPGAAGCCVHEGEVYVTTSQGLLRLRIGTDRPAWTVDGDFSGSPALFGEHVYAVRTSGGKTSLAAFDRARGAEAAACDLKGPAAGVVAVGTAMAAVDLGGGNHALLQRAEKDGKLVLTAVNDARLDTVPLVNNVVVARIGDAWQLLGAKGKNTIAGAKHPLGLIEGSGPATALDGILVFGTWALDFQAMEVLWHVRHRKGIDQFAKGVRYGIVPAGNGLLLAVTADGRSLHALEREALGS